jgi:hypothetical protein
VIVAAPTEAAEVVKHASIHLNSEPAGAEVRRLSDNRLLGTTPLVDIRPVDGRSISYHFHLAGYTDVQMPFAATSPGRFEVAATLSPTQGSDGDGRTTSSSHRSSRIHDRKSRHTTVSVSARAAVPEAPPRSTAEADLPPFGERNPVRRLRH